MKQSVWKNNEHGYGRLSIILHWLTAVLVIGLFGLGTWMVDLSYYDPNYHRAIEAHKAIGVLFAFVVLARIVLKQLQVQPNVLDEKARHGNLAAHIVHIALYILLLVTVMSGYLMSTSKGAGVDIFGFFEMPALFDANETVGKIAANVHDKATLILILMVAAHAGAALMHHVWHKDHTLKRMLSTRYLKLTNRS